jgi:glycosyltransferase involved in cell wall biosynthesis
VDAAKCAGTEMTSTKNQSLSTSNQGASTLCMVYDAIAEGHGSIPGIALGYVKAALNDGWQVTCIARDLDDSLRNEVEWLPLHVPAKAFLVQWLSARRNIRAALGNRQFDVLHVHQAQVAALADVMQCHFLTRAAYERGCLESRRGLRPAIARIQQQGVLYAEDHYFKNWNSHTRMLFDSELTQKEFFRFYGRPELEEVFLYDFPNINFPTQAERTQAREQLIGTNRREIVVGYLGGVDERKGYSQLRKALLPENELFLLMGGPHSQGAAMPELAGRFKSLGMVHNTAQFYAACDVFIVPSRFEPFGLVASEAASRGLPVIATDEVGALPHLLEFGAGVRWQPNKPLGLVARDAVARRAEFNEGAQRIAQVFSSKNQTKRLLEIYRQIREDKQRYDS